MQKLLSAYRKIILSLYFCELHYCLNNKVNQFTFLTLKKKINHFKSGKSFKTTFFF